MPPNEDDVASNLREGNAGIGSSGGIQRYVVFLRRYWWIPLLTLLLGIAGAVCFILWAPPVYNSSASMWETEKLHLSEGVLFTEDPTTYIGTQIELLKSSRMGQAALERLRAAGTNGVPIGKDGLPMRILLSFKEPPKSAVFGITASSADPDYSRNYLDALMNEYLDYKKNVRKLVSGDTAASISAQVETSERALQADQDALSVFQRTNNMAILQEEGTIAGGYLEKLQTELSDLRLESQLLQTSMTEQKAVEPGNFTADRSSVDLIKEAGFMKTPTGDDARLTPYEEVEILKSQREKLSKYLRPKHPKIIALDEEIARAEKLVELFRGQNRDQLIAAQGAVEMKMKSVVASIKDWEGKVTESSARIAEAERLKQNVARDQSLFERLSTLLRNVDITRNTDLETLAVLENASVAKREYKQMIAAGILAVLGGLALGAGIVFLVQKRDDRFTCVSEVNSALGDCVVGQLPEINEKGKESLPLLEIDDPRHDYLESYRSLRSGLRFMAIEGEKPKVFLITSAMPNEGKSTIAVNLARTLARSGSKVLLVDGDLRRGALHELLKMQREPGLKELLLGKCALNEVIQRDTLPNFAFLSCGSEPRDPGDLFLGSELDRIVGGMRQEFDYVIFDSSPLFAADDASCLAPKADGTLFVVRRGRSSARAVGEAVNLLVQRQARLLGVIFNGADSSARTYYFYKDALYHASARNGE